MVHLGMMRHNSFFRLVPSRAFIPGFAALPVAVFLGKIIIAPFLFTHYGLSVCLSIIAVALLITPSLLVIIRRFHISRGMICTFFSIAFHAALLITGSEIFVVESPAQSTSFVAFLPILFNLVIAITVVLYASYYFTRLFSLGSLILSILFILFTTTIEKTDLTIFLMLFLSTLLCAVFLLGKLLVFSGRFGNNREQFFQDVKMAGLAALISGFTHDINNPLTYLSGNLQFLQEDIAALTSLTEAATRNSTNQAEISHVTNDAKDILKDYKAGFLQLKAIVENLKLLYKDEGNFYTNCDLTALLKLAIGLLKKKLPEHIVIKSTIDDQFSKECLPSDFMYIYKKIIEYAVQMVNGEGTITVTGKADAASYCCALRFPANDPNGKKGTTGTDLTVCKEIAAKYRASLTIQHEEHGTAAMYLTIPRDE